MRSLTLSCLFVAVLAAHGFTAAPSRLASHIAKTTSLGPYAVPRTTTQLSLVELPQQSALEVSADYLSSSSSFVNQDFWIFLAGIFPFAWATVEFWSRIAVGKPFGTGKDSVYIGKDNAPLESRGRRVLDQGAFTVAYILFGISAGVIGLTMFSVLTSSPQDSF